MNQFIISELDKAIDANVICYDNNANGKLTSRLIRIMENFYRENCGGMPFLIFTEILDSDIIDGMPIVGIPEFNSFPDDKPGEAFLKFSKEGMLPAYCTRLCMMVGNGKSLLGAY